MQRIAFMVLITLVVLATPAAAENAEKKALTYYEDPVYKPISDGDEHPMSELLDLAEKGDTRAQFILGDLYAKGKGGLVKSEEKGAQWFTESAKNGYGPSFIRLAALAKRRGDHVAAWSWYDLGSSYAGGKDGRYAARARDALERDTQLSDADISAARQLSSDFRRARDEAEEKRAVAARAAREAAEAKAKADSDKAVPVDKKQAKKDGAKKEAAADYQPPSFTQRYNP